MANKQKTPVLDPAYEQYVASRFERIKAALAGYANTSPHVSTVVDYGKILLLASFIPAAPQRVTPGRAGKQPEYVIITRSSNYTLNKAAIGLSSTLADTLSRLTTAPADVSPIQQLPIDPATVTGVGESVKIREYNPADPSQRNVAHNGLDLSAGEGTPLYAVKAGVVSNSGFQETTTTTGKRGAGNFLYINHKQDGTQTVYMHLSQRLVSTGQSVEPGTLLGYVGSTGGSTGNHLHVEYRSKPATNDLKAGVVDPLAVFNASLESTRTPHIVVGVTGEVIQVVDLAHTAKFFMGQSYAAPTAITGTPMHGSITSPVTDQNSVIVMLEGASDTAVTKPQLTALARVLSAVSVGFGIPLSSARMTGLDHLGDLRTTFNPGTLFPYAELFSSASITPAAAASVFRPEDTLGALEVANVLGALQSTLQTARATSNLRAAAVGRVYDTAATDSRAMAYASMSRTDHTRAAQQAAQNAQVRNNIKVAGLSKGMQDKFDEVTGPAASTLVGVQFDFATGLWSDKKCVGKIVGSN